MEPSPEPLGDRQGLVASWHDIRYPLVVLGLVIFVVRIWRSSRIPCESISPLRQSPKAENISSAEPPAPVSTDIPDEKPRQTNLRSPLSLPKPTLPESRTSKPRSGPKRVIGSKVVKLQKDLDLTANKIQPLIFFSSLTGTTEKYTSSFAKTFQSSLEDQGQILRALTYDLSYIDYDDYFVTLPQTPESPQPLRYFYLFLLPTYNIDTVLNNLLEHFQETHHDFRVDTAPLSGLAGYSVFGFGDREGWQTEQEGFCSQALEVDKWMARLTSRKRAFPVGMGDVKSDVNERFMEWTEGVCSVVRDIVRRGGLGEGVPGSGNALESDEELDSMDEAFEANNEPNHVPNRRHTRQVDDLEDIKSRSLASSTDTPLPIDFTTSKTTNAALPEPKEMVPTSSPTYAALTKQGYAIIGSHSGVKICRWTKSALRGRGSCYKYSFYGIKSHLCMETTPSLSCSNKCVFCWRHGTNPVGTSWRWKVDPPDMIFEGAKEAHVKKIKMMRGVPGVRAERFQEAMRIRHCALSLVGEPIFYPHINEFLRLLHAERISSFLVCNAQHPEQLAALGKVTQLYVSVDASNKESLRKVDRPLHRDFWERFLKCLDIIRAKRFEMRTVFRLTLVKGFNVEDEAEGYAELVGRGLPCFVEVKGVTYCGTSSSAGAGLTMQNVPFYEEVVAFVEALNAALGRRGLDYGIAAEHAHSCCILIASKRFLIEGKWHTLIDYDGFFACLESGGDFAPENYVGPPTPEWATFGHGGFNPADERVHRKGRHKAQRGSGSAEAEDGKIQ
ncbi:MAG: hypothetical protein L6R42_001889 [Xanthoria sp. 1 TBL-2021]|nr:MAG: hypothetical protein L6R42_001889 [Xanthoria sp. 1 TBL-2021]